MDNMRLIDEPITIGGMGYLQKTVGKNDSVGFFSFNWAITTAEHALSDRCDMGYVGPSSFHEIINGICNCGNVDNDESTREVCVLGVATLESISFAQPVYLAPPTGYICYQELRDGSVEELFCRHHWNSNSRTLQELFKLMYEWSDCYVELNSDLRIAKTAHGLLVDLEVPQEIESWIRTSVPDQSVMRFLNGDTSARDRALDVPDMTDEFSHFLWKKLDRVMSFGAGNAKNMV